MWFLEGKCWWCNPVWMGLATIFLHRKKRGTIQKHGTHFRKMFAVVYGFGFGAESYPS